MTGSTLSNPSVRYWRHRVMKEIVASPAKRAWVFTICFTVKLIDFDISETNDATMVKILVKMKPQHYLEYGLSTVVRKHSFTPYGHEITSKFY